MRSVNRPALYSIRQFCSLKPKSAIYITKTSIQIADPDIKYIN